MNPTDQARKEARRKELKKNRKQRSQVRQAVIKQKDPKIIFAEMEAIDKMEYDPNNPPPYSVKVLQDKRRKLKETWLKIYQFYQREDPKLAYEIKSMELDYERRRSSMMMIYESVMQAQRVKLDDIPLPEFSMPAMPSDIESSANDPNVPKSILKPLKLVSSSYDNLTDKQPPGPPPGLPPSLSEFECETDQFELGISIEDSYKLQDKQKKIRFENQAPDLSKHNIPQVVGQIAPPPPPVTASTIQQSLLTKSYMNRANVPPYPPTAYPGRPHQAAVPKQSTSQQNNNTAMEATQLTTIQAQPVLRNKIAEITRFVPTSLVVKRDPKKPSYSSSQSFVPSQVTANQSEGPFNYMLQQQQQYATLNPLNTYKSAIRSTSPVRNTPIISSMSKPTANMSSRKNIAIVAAPSVQRTDNEPSDYENFMKEIDGL